MHKGTRLLLSLSTALLTTCLSHQTAFANDANDQIALEEVVVYGTKRSVTATAQQVPTQIAAFGKDALDAKQVVTLSDLSFASANISLDDLGTAPGIANFSIRGQGINSSIPSVDPTVGIFMNGVYFGVSHGIVTDMFDMESVEIHKGPQGVLFGRNVTGGAVLLRTARPGSDTQVSARVGFETDKQFTYDAAIEGALNDKTNAKLAFYHNDDNGYFDNPTLGRKVGKRETYIVRPTLVFTPTSTIENTLIIEHGETIGDGAVSQNSANQNPSSPSKEIETVSDHAGMININWDQWSNETIIDLGTAGTITNVLGARSLRHSSKSDIDTSALDIFHAGMELSQKQWSNELRFNGQLSERLEMLSGLYYYQADLTYFEFRRLFGDFINLGINQAPVRLGGGGQQDHKTIGSFFNFYYAMSEDVTLQAGLRYSSEEKDVVINPNGTCDDYKDCQPGNDASNQWTFWSGKVGAEWRYDDDVIFYAHWARSHRAGGFNFRTSETTPSPFDPERVDSFELGFKSDLLNQRLRFNGAAFVNNINDIQREVSLPSPTGGLLQDITNTGDTRIKGLEMDVIAVINDTFSLNASMGLLDGDYTNLSQSLINNPANPDDDLVVDEADYALEIPRLSKFTLSIGGVYDIDLESGNFSARLDYAFRSKAPYSDNNVGYFNAYKMLNAGITYRPNTVPWIFDLYAKNLTNTAVLGGVTVLPFGSFGSNYLAPLSKGRRFGANIRFEF